MYVLYAAMATHQHIKNLQAKGCLCGYLQDKLMLSY